MFKDFVPMQLGCLRKYTELIPGTVDTVNTLRSEFGLKIGSTTGFLKNMVDILLEDAKKQGYQPDSSVAGRYAIYCDIHGSKNDHLQMKTCDVFYFCSKHRFLARNLCFRVELRKYCLLQ